jgi:U3 small nucleolar RNA-associated protein 13
LTVLLGHSESVLAVAFVPESDTVLTGSSDRTVKLWRPLDSPETRSALCSVIAHDRDVTALAVSLDGKIAATASMDKTAKLWKLNDDRISLLFTLGGHRRTVTAVAFSAIEKVVATGGSDNAVKLWAVDDGSCLATFTEFGGTIAALSFIRAGVQLLVGESRGAVKVVRVKTGATDFAVDSAHSGQIWNVIATDDGLGVISCGTDGKICIWHDNTDELEEQERAAKDEATVDEQALKNALRSAQYVVALRLAFKLRMPNKLRLVVREISEHQSDALVEYFSELEDLPDYEQWLDYVGKWATNSRWTDDATEVITALLKVKPLTFFTGHRKAFQTKIDSIIPYLERHLGRLDRLGIQAYAIDEVLDSGDIR